MINMDYFKRALVLKMLEFFASRHFWFEFNAFLYRRREREKKRHFLLMNEIWLFFQKRWPEICLTEFTVWFKKDFTYVIQKLPSNILNTTFSLCLKKWLLVGTRHFHRKIVAFDVLFDQYSIFLKVSMTFVYWLEGL